MMKSFALVGAGAVVGALAVIGTADRFLPAGVANAAGQETYLQLNLFGDVFHLISTEYVDAIDPATLIRAAINGMVSELDPHSSYLAPVGFQDVVEQTQGAFGGVGIEILEIEGEVTIVSPIDDTPAFRAGLLSGDVITHVDGVAPANINEAVSRMRGEPGTTVVLTIRRQGAAAPLEVTIVRAIIQVRSVTSRIESSEAGDVGYVRLSTFNARTAEEMAAALTAMLAEQPDLVGFIIDLRNNPGGLFEESIEAADVVLDRGEILSTRWRDRTDRYTATPGDAAQGLPIIVLVNAGTASSSEIMAGALKDQERAIILGTRTFGKGSVQTVIPLLDDGALRLTTARYYTPAGTSIQATGITPDVVVRQFLPEELMELLNVVVGETSLTGHLNSEGAEESDVTAAEAYIPPREDDVQLAYALALLRGETPPESGPVLTPADEAEAISLTEGAAF